MTIERMDHVGVVVEDMQGAIDFFVRLGLELEGKGSLQSKLADRVNGLEGIHVDIAFVATPDGHNKLELIQFHSPQDEEKNPNGPSNRLGLRHLCFAVDDLNAIVADLQENGNDLVGSIENYEDIYLLCYVHGPEGIIVELAEKIGTGEPAL